ncbi:hypothetical protein CC80DRAFT_525259 [Byssothecium circinans]|uniref:N-acetyltransferase domain-containing protein n=1 Tax=Byssothecium circinans TaxID=147558 RepID=A0A6A5TXF1_9PLEO|nr:hypothetical protein CC80DRAFT_525259 [Byssothecium circinans]
MGYVVLPALIPDIVKVYDVYFAAFADDAITKALFPGTPKEDMLNPESEFRKTHAKHVLAYWHTSSTQYTLKCIDTETNEIVGMGLLDVYITPSEWKKGGLLWLQGEERERAEALLEPMWNAREKLFDEERYVYPHVIAVHPDVQRKGIGKLLTEYGLRVAEQADLPAYLESSMKGEGLYEKLGFRRLQEKIVHKAGTVMTGTADVEIPLMVWVPEGREDILPKAVKDILPNTGKSA